MAEFTTAADRTGGQWDQLQPPPDDIVIAPCLHGDAAIWVGPKGGAAADRRQADSHRAKHPPLPVCGDDGKRRHAPRAGNLAQQKFAPGASGMYDFRVPLFGAMAWSFPLIFQQPHAKKIAGAGSAPINAYQKAATGGCAPFSAAARLLLPGPAPAIRCVTLTGRIRISLWEAIRRRCRTRSSRVIRSSISFITSRSRTPWTGTIASAENSIFGRRRRPIGVTGRG